MLAAMAVSARETSRGSRCLILVIDTAEPVLQMPRASRFALAAVYAACIGLFVAIVRMPEPKFEPTIAIPT